MFSGVMVYFAKEILSNPLAHSKRQIWKRLNKGLSIQEQVGVLLFNKLQPFFNDIQLIF